MLNALAMFLIVALIVLLVVGVIAIHFVLWLIPILLYFLPTFIAWRRKHPSTFAIFALNVLVGWTVLGWFATLAWSILGTTDRSRAAAA